MAITFDAAASGAVDTGTSLTFAHTCTGSNLVLWVGVVSGATPTVTYNGVSLTSAGTITSSGGWIGTLFYLVAPSTGVNNVVISSASDFICGTSASYTGCAQTGVPESSPTTQADANAGTHTLSETTVADNAWTVMVAGCSVNNGVTAGTGSTVRSSAATTANIASSAIMDSAAAITPAGAYSQSAYAQYGTNHVLVMASFAPAGGGATPYLVMPRFNSVRR